MKHWIIGGAAAIVGTVLIFRSRTAPEQTVPTPTAQGVIWPMTKPVVQTRPATTRGIPINSLPQLKIAPATQSTPSP